MGVDLVDLLELAPPFDLGGVDDGHGCIDIVDILLLAPPFACMGEEVGGHSCIDIVGILLLAPPFGCLGVEIDLSADVGLEAASGGLIVEPLPLDLELYVPLRRFTIYGNGDYPPFGDRHSIPQPVMEGLTMFIVSRAQRLKKLLAWKGVDFLKSGSIAVKLFTNDVDIDPDTVPGDFVEPTGDWYTAIATAALKDPVYNNAGVGVMTGAITLEFLYSGSDPLENVKGYFVVDGNGDYAGGEVFDEPSPMGKVGDAVQVTLQFSDPEGTGAAVEA